MMKRVLNYLQLILLIVWAVIPSTGFTADTDDTMLMFVGEDLNVLSIASRREESARQAPAVANVITREMLESSGVYTLSQALEQMPGFYMGKKEWGTQPYLRGIPDSFLLLHDTVPLSSDMTKSVHPLDEDLSLASVKRIELIRGPGSVLWGPDAFAGIVNVVPLTGKDINGTEAGVNGAAPGGARGFYINSGHNGGSWDSFLSVSGREANADDRTANVVSFWGNNGLNIPVAPEERFGQDRAGRPQYLEFNGNINVGDWLTLSGRYADDTRPYIMSEENNTLSWIESRSTPVDYIKLDLKKDLDPDSALRYTGYYSSINSTYKVIDLEFSPKEYTIYNEMVYDRKFFSGDGQLTTGAALRRKQVDNAPIWDSYLPDYLGSDNTVFLPGIKEKDYRTNLWSLFGQYAHKIGKVDLSAGVRYDNQEAYKNSLSYNTGIVWSFAPEWIIKALYGTAYRTPFASQLIETAQANPEEIQTTSVELSWEPNTRYGASVCGFINQLADHIMEDPYAGLSQPNHQKIQGIEFEGHVSPVPCFQLGANFTVMANSGPDETYQYVDYVFVRPDGTIENHYASLSYPYNTGPDTLFNLTGTWKPTDRITFFNRVGYFASQEVICPRCGTSQSVPGVWLMDSSLAFRDVWMPGLDLHFSIRNLADKQYLLPGTYSTIDGDPFSAMVMLTKRW